MNLDFAQALLLLGGLLAVAAALSGWLNASILSISVLAVVAGIVLAAFDVVSVEPGSSSVVTAPRVPALVRHTLNLESGLNDGLALPFVLFFLTLAEPGGNAASSALELLGKVAVGALIGLGLAFLGGRVLQRLPGGGI